MIEMAPGRHLREKFRPDEAVQLDVDIHVEGDCAEYSAWADRLHEHGDALARVREVEEVAGIEPSFWSTSHILRDTSFGRDLTVLEERHPAIWLLRLR